MSVRYANLWKEKFTMLVPPEPEKENVSSNETEEGADPTSNDKTEEGTSKVENDDGKTTNQVALWKRVLVFMFAPFLVVSNVISIANMFLNEKLTICSICPTNPSLANFFIYISSWCLWSGTAAFALWSVACFRPKNRSIKTWTRRLFNVSLPWTTTVTITYSVYLAQGGRDLDEDACYTVWEQAISRDTSPGAAYTYICFSIVTNITVHYLLFIVNVVLYASKSIRYNQMLPFGLLFFILNGVVVGIIQSQGYGVYCSDNIWLSLGLQWVVFAVAHVIYFFGYQRCMRDLRNSEGKKIMSTDGEESRASPTEDPTGSSTEVKQ